MHERMNNMTKQSSVEIDQGVQHIFGSAKVARWRTIEERHTNKKLEVSSNERMRKVT